MEDDSDFNDFDNDISSSPNDMPFDKNVMEGIELGSDEKQQNARKTSMWKRYKMKTMRSVTLLLNFM